MDKDAQPYAINYGLLSTVAIKGIQEQQVQIASMSAQIAPLSNVLHTDGTRSMTITGDVGIGTTSPTSKLQVVGLPEYAGNAAAIAAGLTTGAFYRTGELVKVVY